MAEIELSGGEVSKGTATCDRILDQAVELSSQVGLEGLTLGELAKRISMSKSGLYAHFDSKENLQCEVLDTAARRFVEVVVTPMLKAPRGLPRIETLYAQWLRWAAEEFRGGCLFMAAAMEFDDRPGPVRERLLQHQRDMLDTIARAASIAVEEGHFAADLDPEQFAFDFWGMLMAYHNFARLLNCPQARVRADRSFSQLVERSRLAA